MALFTFGPSFIIAVAVPNICCVVKFYPETDHQNELISTITLRLVSGRRESMSCLRSVLLSDLSARNSRPSTTDYIPLRPRRGEPGSCRPFARLRRLSIIIYTGF